MKEFEKIIGYSEEKKELEQIADVLKNREAYKKLGVKPPRGLLIHGDPGVGKTLMAQCLIDACGLDSYVIRKHKYEGDFIDLIEETFAEAADNAPCIILLDDMDKFSNADERHCNTEEFVTIQSCIDTVKDLDVFVVATTNNMRCLPPSLRRPGRFDRIMEISEPRGKDAVKIISHYLSDKPVADDLDMEYIAKLLNGFSCAKLETILNEAGLYAGFERKDKVTMEHFLKAYLRDRYGSDVMGHNDNDPDGDSDFLDAYSRYNDFTSHVLYHEVGHAVVSEILDPGSVTLISIGDKNTKRSSGFTSYCLSEKISPMYERLIKIVSALGGAASVEQKFGIRTGGTSADFVHANRILTKMTDIDAVYGFNNYDAGYESSTQLKYDQERMIRNELERYYLKAKEIISLNMEFVDNIAYALSKKKMLTMAEIKAIRKISHIVTVSV